MGEEIFSLDMNLVWLLILIILIVLEASTVNLVAIWFALGGLAALFSSVLGAPPWAQVTIFIVTALLSLIATRPFVKKLLLKKNIKTNFDRIIGMTGVVTEEIDNIKSTGYVHVDGKDWMARSENGDNVSENKNVTVLRIEGVKIFVKENK